MATLASRIAAYSRRPSATVRLGGVRWRGIISLGADQSYGSGVSSGEVVGRASPVPITEGSTTISWTWGYDGYEVAGFSGIVTKIVQKSYPNRWQLHCADPLWKADIRSGDLAASPINDIAASVAIGQFLTAAGVTRYSIPPLAAAGSAWTGAEWTLGQLTPVVFSNTTPLQACQRMCEALGYWLYCDSSGIVRAVLMERRPSDTPFRSLRWGTDFLLAGPPDRERDGSQVKNKVTVRGGPTGVQGAQIYDSWQTGAADRVMEYSSDLVEYVNESEAGNASCTAIAKRLLTLWSRQPDVIKIGKLKADPRVRVGHTVAIDCSLIGVSNKPFFVYGVSTKLDLQKGDFSQSLTLDGGTGSSGYTTVPPPAAAFAWRLVGETLGADAVIEVFLDGSGSQSFGGDMVSWAWSTATTTYGSTPSTTSGVHAMLVFPAATTSAVITLTVTDTSSKTGALTQTVTLAGDALTTVNRRVFNVALGAARAVSPDGGASWAVDATGDSVTVPEVGGLSLFTTTGAGNTNVARTDDQGATWQDLGSCGGSVTALWQTQDSPTRLWVGVGTTLYRSVDNGVTRALWGTLPASVTGVIEDPDVLNSVFVLAGANVYHSTLDTPGLTGWVVLYAGPTGAIARQIVRGQSGACTWVAYTGTFIGSPLQRIEGPITATFPVVSPDVTEIRAIALSTDEKTCYAWDSEGRGWAVLSDTGIAVAITATLGAGETAQHARHDPDDSIVYLATFGATQGSVYKYWPLADRLGAFYTPSAGQQAHRIGFGEAQAVRGRVLLPTYGDTPGGVWSYVDGVWTLNGTGLPSGIYWYWIAAHPFASTDLLLFGNSSNTSQFKVTAGVVTRQDGGPIAYRSVDSGATWAALTLTTTHADSSTFGISEANMGASATSAAWAIVGGQSGEQSFWRIDTTGTTFAAYESTASGATVAGARDSAYLLSGMATRKLTILDNANVATTPTGAAQAADIQSITVQPGATWGALVMATLSVARTTDYRTAQPTPILAGAFGLYMAALADGRVLLSTMGGAGGVSSLPDAFSTVSPATTTVALGGLNVINVVSDAQTQTIAAALTSSKIALMDSLGAWQEISLPPGASIGDGIEITSSEA